MLIKLRLAVTYTAVIYSLMHYAHSEEKGSGDSQ